MKPMKEVYFLERLGRWYQFLVKVPFTISMLLIMVLMFLTGADVIGRAFGRPIHGSYQMSELTQLWIICMAWPFTVKNSSHVSVVFFISKRSPLTKKIAAILTRVIAMSVFAAITWQGFEMVRRSYEQVELVNILDVPIFTFQLAVPIGALITFVVLFAQLCMLAVGRNIQKVEKA